MGSEDEGGEVDDFYLDFSKSFYTVSHVLVARLKGYGLNGSTGKLHINWLDLANLWVTANNKLGK